MHITFEGPAVLVTDIDRSRKFYEHVLDQKVLADHGPHVAFASKFFIWQAEHAMPIMTGGTRQHSGKVAHDNFELYFECADIEAAFAKARKAGAEIIHGVVEQPWLQKGFRIKDPDGHVVEIAEPLPALVKRLMADGMTAEDVHKATSIPLEGVRAMAEG